MSAVVDLARTSIDVLGLSRRAYNRLQRGGIDTVPQLAALGDDELLAIPSLGPALLGEIRQKLEDYVARQPLAAPPSPEPQDAPGNLGTGAPSPTPLDMLGLSTRPYNALMRSGITTVERLACAPLGQFVGVRHLGLKSAAEIQSKLKAYLDAHPEVLCEVAEAAPPAPSAPPVDPELLACTAYALLDQIPLQRLALPTRQEHQFYAKGIRSIGEFVRQADGHLTSSPEMMARLERYLVWLAEQGRAAWDDEVAERGMLPLYRLKLAETTLATLISQWLAPLDARREQVIRWRYGLNGKRRTLKQIGQELGFTRQRARQIQMHALSILAQPGDREQVAPLAALCHHLLAEAGGLMDARELAAALRREMTVGDIDPLGAFWLLSRVDQDLLWLRNLGLAGLTRYPLKAVEGVQKRFARVLKKQKLPLSTRELLNRFKRKGFYKKHQEQLDDDFLLACLRVHPDIDVQDGTCTLLKWSGKRLDEMILALRELGEPAHYTVIAERTNARLPADKQVSARNIHVHIHRRSDVFVRVGKGIFGLREWGLPDDGNLANAAYRVLCEMGQPLDADALIDRVLETWHARPASVHTAIASDARFCRRDDGALALAEWSAPL
jgi:hypothetical protein